jgi:NADPH-dependent 2,4-dienoyl-CoA reductase/sulfur reductase-like enzyme
MDRRHLLQGMAVAPAMLAASWMSSAGAQTTVAGGAGKGLRVVVVGGGFAGVTAARYLKRWASGVDITVIEPSAKFVTCPMSNRVIYGGLVLKDISHSYNRFIDKSNIRWVKAFAQEIDVDKREVRTGTDRFVFDKLIIAPGVDYNYDSILGLQQVDQQAKVPHAWKAGEQTLQLRNRLMAMPDNGVIAMHIPKAPYRCPPGPYERASLIAHFLKQRKPKSKLMVFDANPEIQAKKGLFEAAWKSRYAGVIEYIPNANLKAVDAATQTLELDVQGKFKTDVLNVIPPQRAGVIAQKAGLANVEQRWCGVDFLTYESTAAKGVYVLGDSIASAPGMPKSAHMANQEAKICAGAIAAEVLGEALPSEPIITNTCYSFVSHNEVIHVAAVYRYDKEKKVMAAVAGAGGLSDAPNMTEGIYAMAWITNIVNDTLGS